MRGSEPVVAGVAMSFLLSLGASALAAVPPLSIEAIAINPANGHEYLLTERTSWVHGQIEAIKRGGNLVTINNAAEQNWVYSTFGRYNNNSRLLWIGLTDATSEGQLRWVSGQTTSYGYWASGEPNGSTAQEDYVAMYYPGHSQQGRWNDWNSRYTDPIGVPFHAVIERDPDVLPPEFFLETDSSWKLIAPDGNREGTSITAVGLAWEAANRGWNSSLQFNTSSWQNAQNTGLSIWGSSANSPVYLRKSFVAPGKPESVMLLAGIDDDAQVYINGSLVLNDIGGGAGDFGPIDITRYVTPGENLIAVKAHDSVGGGQSIRLAVYGNLPEPGSMTAFATAAIFAGLRRRRGR